MRNYALIALCASALIRQAPAAVIDVVVVVDESGSMSGEHAWLPGMISTLDSRLTTLGHTGRYGLVGFGSSGAGINGRTLATGATAVGFGLAAGGLVTTGGTEDGYSGLTYTFNNYGFAGGSTRNYILVTDEDRDNNGASTFATVLGSLQSQNALLNAVVNNPFSCSAGAALGRTTLNGYQVEPAGAFSACASPLTGNGAGTTETDYVPLALQSGGAAWDLNVLRSGGNDAASFTSAFVDIKVEEIQQQIPEPSTYALAGTALVTLIAARRRVG